MRPDSAGVAVIGTLDTKAAEIRYVRDAIRAAGLPSFVIDSGILGTAGLEAEIPRELVAEAAGHTLKEIQDAGSRGAAVELMQQGLSALVRDLYDSGLISGVLCLGGAEGGLMGAAAMQSLPVGVPKLIVSPSASGPRQFGPFVGSSDVMVMHSVIDILGLNAIARSVFDNAVAAMVGMVKHAGELPRFERPAIGITMLGQTTPGASVLAADLEAAGLEPVIFHANGVGGPAMDAFARDGLLAGVVDFTLSEPANSLFDGLHATGPHRMRAAVEAGLPLLVVPGAADFFNQGPMSSVPERFRSRQLYHHNPVATLVRVEAEEMFELGALIASRLEGATAPTEVVVPVRGLSLIGVEGGAIESPAADSALIEGLRAHLPAGIELVLVDDHINSEQFGHTVAARFLGLMERAGV
ncbi:MAG TPA: Tm-1-like ATP-binding domain-containing protein [Pseudolysinimonas sp.]